MSAIFTVTVPRPWMVTALTWLARLLNVPLIALALALFVHVRHREPVLDVQPLTAAQEHALLAVTTPVITQMILVGVALGWCIAWIEFGPCADMSSRLVGWCVWRLLPWSRRYSILRRYRLRHPRSSSLP